VAREGETSRPPAGEGGEGLLQGTIERVTYADAKSSYSVLRLLPEKGYGPPASTDLFRAERCTAVGKTDAPTAGLRVRLRGRWSHNPAHGQQFEFEELTVLPPDDRMGLVKYLSSERFPGVGEKTAERIVDRLGLEALDKILAEPALLESVPGLKRSVREALVAAARHEQGSAHATAFLRSLGLGPLQAAAVLKRLGPECEAELRRDPYLLVANVPGFGFASADKLASSLGLAGDDPRRVRAAIVHALHSAAEDGHSLLARDELGQAVRELVTAPVDEPRFAQELAVLAERRDVVVERSVAGAERVYLPALAHCETELARNLARLLAAGPVKALADAGALAAFERSSGLDLHPTQRAAVLGLLATPVGLLTGGPGVGKTTITRAVVELARRARARVLLASPTGRAAKRLAEATDTDAQTVHRLLGYEPAEGGFLHDLNNPIEAELVIVDEISMLDVTLAHHLLKALRPPTRLVLIGDPDQLPSVGPGNVLRDLLNSGVVPSFRLTQIFRQAQDSRIVVNAHRIQSGELPVFPERGDRSADFYFFREELPERAAERLIEVVTQRIPANFGLDWTDDVQVIAPMYRGPCGVDALNERLREIQGRLAPGRREVRQGARVWRVGERVLHTRNDYEKEVFNGDMGRIQSIGEGPEARVVVRFPEREVLYVGSELSDLTPAFAITVHRSQGGEFPCVVMPLTMQHALMLQRNLLYTAVTRARKLVVLVGSQRALELAVANADQNRRESALAEKLAAALERRR